MLFPLDIWEAMICNDDFHFPPRCSLLTEQSRVNKNYRVSIDLLSPANYLLSRFPQTIDSQTYEIAML
jgi:hypothetical protein